MSESRPTTRSLQDDISRLLSLHDGERGVLAVVEHGPSAIAELRRLLYQREPSGLYEPRRRVVDALAALGAEDVLLEFLACAREFPDPVENAGEEAVLNAAAVALRCPCDDGAFTTLLSLAERRHLPGAIRALASCRSLGALPCFIEALADDIARPAAEEAIQHIGMGASPLLVRTLHARGAEAGDETDSDRRRQGAALKLLLELGAACEIPSWVRQALMTSEDHAIAISSCRASLLCGLEPERRSTVDRLIEFLSSPQWHIRLKAEECLLAHAGEIGHLLDAIELPPPPPLHDLSPKAAGARALHHIATRIAMARDHGG